MTRALYSKGEKTPKDLLPPAPLVAYRSDNAIVSGGIVCASWDRIDGAILWHPGTSLAWFLLIIRQGEKPFNPLGCSSPRAPKPSVYRTEGTPQPCRLHAEEA